MAKACFQLKAGMVTLTTLELHQVDLSGLEQQMAETVKQAPMFFQGAPVLLSVEQIDAPEQIDLDHVVQCCRQYGLHPIALKGQRDIEQNLADRFQLAFLPSHQNGREPASTPAVEPEVVIERVIEERIVNKPSMIVNQPVRSGQQVYAKDCDLIIMAPVSAGAEVLSDGHIHVYAALRGRALAGVQGDREARIFCQSLEAELISIAGSYKLNEDLQQQYWKQPIHAHLTGDTLHIEPV